METSTFNLQIALSKVETSVVETYNLLAEVQSRLGNVYEESTDRVYSLESKVSKMDKTIKGYIDGHINELQQILNQGNIISNPVSARKPANSVEGV